MKPSKNSRRRQAFSLIELLAVIAIIGILFTLVSPQIGKARLRARLTQESAKARYIVEAITAKEVGSRFSTGWPKGGEYGSSTDFLRGLVQDGYLDVEFSFFAGPGMVPARAASDFSSENNAWCIVENLDDTRPGNFPAVFSRNVRISGGSGLQVLANEAPFGDKGFAFATKNGEAISVEQAELRGSDFPYIFNLQGQAVSVLQP